MRTVGNGPDKPVEDNATPEGREKNRRTDIKVYPNPAQVVSLASDLSKSAGKSPSARA